MLLQDVQLLYSGSRYANQRTACISSLLLCSGKRPSKQMHILSTDKIMKGQPALHLSVTMPFEVWDHAVCVVPALPGFPCGCLVVIGGRVMAQQGFSQVIYVINLDPRSGYDAKRARLRCASHACC